MQATQLKAQIKTQWCLLQRLLEVWDVWKRWHTVLAALLGAGLLLAVLGPVWGPHWLFWAGFSLEAATGSALCADLGRRVYATVARMQRQQTAAQALTSTLNALPLTPADELEKTLQLAARQAAALAAVSPLTLGQLSERLTDVLSALVLGDGHAATVANRTLLRETLELATASGWEELASAAEAGLARS
jgi:hypothetical protein